MIVPVYKLWGLVQAITIWPFMFIRRDSFTLENTNHEMIHYQQQKELLLIFAILWYILEYLCKLVFVYKLNTGLAYRNVSFEREAYENEINYSYLDDRKPYSFLKYVNVKDKLPEQ